MLEPPDLQDEHISACVRDAYGVRVAHVAFLPLGVDRNTAVYRVVAKEPPVISNIVGTLIGGMLGGIVFWIGPLSREFALPLQKT